MNAKDLQELKKRILAMRQDRAALVEANRTAVVQEPAEGEERKSLTREELAAVRERFARIDALDAELAALERIEAEASDLELPLRNRVADAGEAGREGARPGPFRSLGEQLVAVANVTRNQGSSDPRLSQMVATGMSEGIPSEGGFLVQTGFSQEIIRRMYENPLLSRVRKLPITVGFSTKLNAVNETSRAAGSRWGGVRGYWLGEGGTVTASRPTFRQIDLSLKKVGALVYATDELLADAAQLEALIMEMVPQELAFMAEEAVFRGTGAGRPQGMILSPAKITVAKETGQAAATIVFENIVKAWSRAYGPSRGQAVWAYNQDIEPQLFTLGITLGVGGAPVWLPAGALAGRPNSTLMGAEMLNMEHASTLGTEGDLTLVEPQEYVLAEKGGVQAASSMHVQFLTDEMVFRFIYRVDGQCLWNAPLTPAQSTTTQSPIVTIATRA